MSENTKTPRGEQGFALILAILALMLLTFLGLTLATTTSSELQIATNYRWSQQALYNAEGGVDVGRQVLRNANWTTLLPLARTTPWTITCTPTAPSPGQQQTCTLGNAQSPTCSWSGTCAPRSVSGVTMRDLENKECDTSGSNMGYGVVMVTGSPTVAYQNIATVTINSVTQTMNGGFTIWLRRPVVRTASATDGVDNVVDYSADDDNLVMTVEGIAPAIGTAGGSRAVKVVEATLSRTASNNVLANARCGTGLSGQAGGGGEGSGFAGCAPVGAGALTQATGSAQTANTAVQ